MANGKVRLTDLPPAPALQNESVTMVNQGGVDYKLPVSRFFQVDKNLSEGSSQQMRANLNVPSVQEVQAWIDAGGGSADLSALSAPDGFRLIGAVSSWAELKTIQPKAIGDVVILRSWHAGLNYGGGHFIAKAGSVSDDGGVKAPVTGSSPARYWERIIHDANDLDVTHFGAKKDGSTDCIGAAQAMLNYTLTLGLNARYIGIRFPAGDFAISSMDISSGSETSRFCVTGAYVPRLGYMGTTRLVLIGANGSFAFRVNARRFEISGLEIYGQYDKGANTRGFLQNITQAGEFCRGSQLRLSQMGGKCFDILDTLDTRFDQFYASNCYDSIIRAGWSNNPNGKWDHSTAIELSNFNIQYSYNTPALDLQRSGQSLIYNGWIEHTEYPGDLSNGQWLIDALSIEDCDNPMDLTHSRVQFRQLNLQSGSSIEYNNPAKSRLLSRYEMGRVRTEAYGTQHYGTFSASTFHSHLRFNNQTDAPAWYYVGRLIAVGADDHTIFRFVGAHGAAPSQSANVKWGDNNFGGGEVILRMRRNHTSGGRHDASVEVIGNPAIADVKLTRPYDNDVSVYVQLKPNSGWVNVVNETTAPSRFDQGTCYVFDPAGTLISDAEIAGMSLYTPRATASLGTMTSGLIIMEDGQLNYTGKALIDGKIPIMYNGVQRLINTEVAPVGSDSFARVGEINATRLDNLLGGTLNQSWVNSSSAGGAMTGNGSLSITMQSAAALALRTDILNQRVEFILVSGPDNPTDSIHTTFDFRRPAGGTGQNAYRLVFGGKVLENGKYKNTVRVAKRVSGNTEVISSDAFIYDGQKVGVDMVGTGIVITADDQAIITVTDDSETALTTGGVIAFGTSSSNAGMVISRFRIYQL